MLYCSPLVSSLKPWCLSCWHPSMAPMCHPTSAVTRAFRGYVLLVPQLVYQDWLTACRSSAPHSSVDTGTPHRRFAGFSVCPGRADCPLFSSITGSRVITATLACVGHHSTSAVGVLLLYCCSLPAGRFLVVRYTAWCSSWRLAASALSLSRLVVCSLLWPRCSHCWTVPFVTLLFFSGSSTA